MNLPTFFIGLLVLGVFLAIVGRGIYNRTHGKNSCSNSCAGCPHSSTCHPPVSTQKRV